MTFISVDDIKTFCPKVKDETLIAVIKSTENLFCGILPLRYERREINFTLNQVWECDGWRWVETSLLNISAATLDKQELQIKTEGRLRNAFYFKGKLSFNPVLSLEIESGYTPESIPEDIRDAMVAYATEQALMIGQGLWSNISSYKMGPRTISFRENSPVRDQVVQTIKKYQL